MKIDRPNFNGKTTEERLSNLETWANLMVERLNYALNFIDETNMVQEGDKNGK